MRHDSGPRVSIKDIMWSPGPDRKKIAPIRIADNSALLPGGPASETLPTLIFSGYGVRKEGMIRLVQHLAGQGHHAVAVDLPFSHPTIRGDRTVAERLAREGPHVVGDVLREEYKTDGPIKALGHSKGAAIVGRAIDEDHTKIGDIVLVQPPELHRADSLTASQKEEKRLLEKLLVDMTINHTDRQMSFEEMRAAGNLLVTFVRDAVTGQFQIMTGPVVTGSLVSPVLEHVEDGNTVLVMSSFRDRVFPGSQIVGTLIESARTATETGAEVKSGGRLLFYEDRGIPHLNTDTQRGRKLLTTAMNRLDYPNGFLDEINEKIQIYPTGRPKIV